MQVESESEITQSCLTLHDSMDCSLPGSSIHGIFQARVLEWVAIVFSACINTRNFKTLFKVLNNYLKQLFKERLKAGEGDNRVWDVWIASPTQWTQVSASSRSWWWTGKPGMLQSMGSQRVVHDWATELNWTDLKYYCWLLGWLLSRRKRQQVLVEDVIKQTPLYIVSGDVSWPNHYGKQCEDSSAIPLLYTQSKWKQDFDEIYTHLCLSQYYSQ